MIHQTTTPEVLLTQDERALLAGARSIGAPDGSVPLPAVSEHLRWPIARARAAADRLVQRGDVRVDSGLGHRDEEVFIDS